MSGSPGEVHCIAILICFSKTNGCQSVGHNSSRGLFSSWTRVTVRFQNRYSMNFYWTTGKPRIAFKVTGLFSDKPARIQASRGLFNSRTS